MWSVRWPVICVALQYRGWSRLAPATANRCARAHGPQKREGNAQRGEEKRGDGIHCDINRVSTSGNSSNSNNGRRCIDSSAHGGWRTNAIRYGLN